MSILEGMKKYWLVIMGIIILTLIAFVGNIFIFLENMLSIFWVPLLVILFIISLHKVISNKYDRFSLAVVVILGFFILSNPNIKDFESYYKYENNIPNNQILSENILRRNFVFFSHYEIKNISHETNSSIQKIILSKKYVGALGHFSEKQPPYSFKEYSRELDEVANSGNGPTVDNLKHDISDFIGIKN